MRHAKSTNNLPLPGFDVHLPICPGCKRAVPMLGQWSPTPSSAYLCRKCSIRYPMPDVFTPTDNSIGMGLLQGAEHAPSREQYHAHSQVLEELAKGCIHTLDDVSAEDYLPCMQDDDTWIMNAYGVSGRGWQRDIEVDFERTHRCRRCRNRLHYIVSQRQQSERWIAQHRDGTNTAHTANLPVCHQCGTALKDGEETYCQQCVDEHTVMSFWNNRGIFGGDDDETILDRIQRAYPGLFENGVMPERWFELRLEDLRKP